MKVFARLGRSLSAERREALRPRHLSLSLADVRPSARPRRPPPSRRCRRDRQPTTLMVRHDDDPVDERAGGSAQPERAAGGME